MAAPPVTPTVHTERLLLEPYVPEDEESFVALFQDTRVSRWMGDGPGSEAADRALFGRILTEVYARDLFDVWAVCRDGHLIGHAEIKPTELSGGHEIIYALALTEVFATVAIQNTASLALLDRIGFEKVRDITEDDGGTTRLSIRSLRADPR